MIWQHTQKQRSVKMIINERMYVDRFIRLSDILFPTAVNVFNLIKYSKWLLDLVKNKEIFIYKTKIFSIMYVQNKSMKYLQYVQILVDKIKTIVALFD